MTVFQSISYGSELYQAECVLRDGVLRQPLGLSLWDEDLSLEKEQWHFGHLSTAGVLIACAVVDPLSPHQAKVRQVAVRPESQRNGVGSQLMQELEEHLRERGFRQVVLHARERVVGFYEALGYRTEGDEFEEVGLLHRKMVKELSSSLSKTRQ